MLEADPDTGVVDVGALYVLKDSLGALFESSGMYQEACNEYSELEAMIEDCVARSGAVRTGVEGDEAGVDKGDGTRENGGVQDAEADGARDGGRDVGRDRVRDVGQGEEGRADRLAYRSECSVSQVAVRVVS